MRKRGFDIAVISALFIISLIAVSGAIVSDGCNFFCRLDNVLTGNVVAEGPAIQATCGETISANTTLAGNVTGCSGNGLNIGADNITLNCNGYTISGPGATGNSAVGVYLNGVHRVTVKNCIITAFGSAGIKTNGNNSILMNNTLIYNNEGIRIDLPEGDNNTMNGNTIIMNSIGINIWGPYHNAIINNNISSNIDQYTGESGTGINLGGAFTAIINNTVNDNGGDMVGYGLYIDGNVDNTIFNNTFNGNKGGEKGVGIYATRGSPRNNITHNQANNNEKYGIYFDYLSFNTTLIDNTANGNGDIGIYFDSTTYSETLSYNRACGNTNTDAKDEGSGNVWTYQTCDTSLGVTCNYPCPYQPACGDTITSNITLTDNLLNCAGNGLNIGADNLVIDCAGFKINGTGANGISATTATNAYTNLTIRNCTIEGFSSSINMSGAANPSANAYNGGNVNIIDSNISNNINAYGGATTSHYRGGRGGTVNLINFYGHDVNVYGGDSYQMEGGTGGNVMVNNSHVNQINNYGGGGQAGDGGHAGNVLLLNSTVSQNINSYGQKSDMGGKGGNVTIIDSNIAGNISNYGGISDAGSFSGYGGNATLINSNATNIFAYGGLGLHSPGLGKGGDVYLVNAIVTGIYVYGGDINRDVSGGKGGNVSIINSSVTIVSAYGGISGAGTGGAGGNVNLIDSNVTIINAYGGDTGDSSWMYNGGSGGKVNLLNSNATQINNYGGRVTGGSGGLRGGDSGSVNITNSKVDIVNSYGGYVERGDYGGAGGSITITNSSATTIYAYGGNNDNNQGGIGGSINITNSNVTTADSHGGGGGGFWGEAGGNIIIINSNVTTADSHGGYAGIGPGGKGGSIIIINSSVTTADSHSGWGDDTGDGGSITITNSNVTTADSHGGWGINEDGGAGGSITIENSNITAANAYGGDGVGGGNGGAGGNVTLINSNLYLTNIAINVTGGLGSLENGTAGTLKLNNSGFYSPDGEIKFFDVSTSETDFDSIMNISDNLITLDSDTYPDYNVSANLTLNELNFTDAKILRDGVECNQSTVPSCYLLSYSEGIAVFNVSSFTNYSVEEGLTEFCGDTICNAGETCLSCQTDCGLCPPNARGGEENIPLPAPLPEEWTTLFSLSEQQAISGIVQELSINEKIDFVIDSQPHYVGITNIGENSATILIASAPQYITLLIGEERKAEVTGDNYYDIYVRLSSIANGKANVEIRQIHELICAESWQCSSWAECIDEKQARTCTDLNNCGTALNKPSESQGCIKPAIPAMAASTIKSIAAAVLAFIVLILLALIIFRKRKPIILEPFEETMENAIIARIKAKISDKQIIREAIGLGWRVEEVKKIIKAAKKDIKKS